MPNHSLRKLQLELQNHVLHGDSDVIGQVAADSDAIAGVRLAIYTNAYRLRLLEALKANYPALHTLAGDEMFDRIGRAYIDAHPSAHYSIRYFGLHLSEFLEHRPISRYLPALTEMARLEWSLSLAFDSADSPTINESAISKLSADAWPGMRLRFHDSLRLQEFSWNVPETWRAIDQRQAPQAPCRYPQPRSWLVWRHELQNYFRPLDAAEACAMTSLLSGDNFGTACAALCDHLDPDLVAPVAAGYLKSWLGAGMVIDLLTC
jgi:hypothetical protein